MKALVLGGGSILGAWEAGAAKAVIEYGYEPDIIVGISVGGLNGAFIANAKATNDWYKVGEVLTDFWKTNITKPSDVAIKRKKIPLVWSVIRNKFNGFTETTPIDSLINQKVHLENIRKSGINLSVGAINVNSGKILYAEPSMPNFKEYLKATKAIPFAMPLVKIGFQTFMDGGLIDSTPIGEAIRKKASEIIVITPHPKDVGGAEVDSGNIVELAERTINIMQNNTLNNDIKIAELVNDICYKNDKPISDGVHKGKKFVPITVIRPDVPISVSLSTFNKADISMMIESGKAKAIEIMKDI
jgi:NTE family protein